METLTTIGPNYDAIFQECPVYSLDPLATHKVVIFVNFTYAGSWSTNLAQQVYFVNGRVHQTEVSLLEAEIEKTCRIGAVRHESSGGNYDPLQHAIVVKVRIQDVPDEAICYPPPPGYKLPSMFLRSSSQEDPVFPAASPTPPASPSTSSGFRGKDITRYWKPSAASRNNSSSSSSSSSGSEVCKKKRRKCMARKSTGRAMAAVHPVGEIGGEYERHSGSEPSLILAEASNDIAYWSEDNDGPPAMDIVGQQK